MENTLALIEDNQTPCCIHSYSEGCLTLRDKQALTSSVIINNKQELSNWSPRSLEELTEIDFAAIIAHKPDIVLLGTGKTFQFPDPKLLAPLYNQGIGVESMDTGAACRSFVALFAESRNVLAALII
jgi:uncharacterized protein